MNNIFDNLNSNSINILNQILQKFNKNILIKD